MRSAAAFRQRTRFVLGGVCILAALAIMAGTWCLPFFFESATIFYKFGLQKALLRGGKIVGLTAAVLLCFQVVLVSRFRFLDKIFALNRLCTCHRRNGIAVAIFSLLHPLMILAADNFTLFTFAKRYWPEFMGVGLLVVIVGIVVTAYWRLPLGLAYEVWLRFHRLLTLLAITAALIHIRFVSETFGAGLPLALVLAAAGLMLLLFLRLWQRRIFTVKRTYTVSKISPTGHDACVLELKPRGSRVFPFLPGQFAFITPLSSNIPKEEHPFTLSSSPSGSDHLQCVIRARGDWTARINRLQTGEAVIVDGPYGLFSHEAYRRPGPLIMIAGGIGITPMLSMLRFMADTNDPSSVLLIWSNKTEASVVLGDVVESLPQRLQHLEMIHVITRENIGGDIRGRLDQAELERLLAGRSRKSRIFVCGPPPMMMAVSQALKIAGFNPARIHTEKFQF